MIVREVVFSDGSGLKNLRSYKIGSGYHLSFQTENGNDLSFLLTNEDIQDLATVFNELKKY